MTEKIRRVRRRMRAYLRLRYSQNAFSGHWLSAARHGVGCYATVRTNRIVTLQMADLASPAEAMGRDFAAISQDLHGAINSYGSALTGA